MVAGNVLSLCRRNMGFVQMEQKKGPFCETRERGVTKSLTSARTVRQKVQRIPEREAIAKRRFFHLNPTIEVPEMRNANPT